MKGFIRILRHLFFPPWWLRVRFPRHALAAIERAVRESETRHAGQIQFAIEASLPLRALLAGVSPRARAEELFATLRVWDTAENNGVLIYLLLADRDVEIVADRGIAARVAPAEWEAICREMEQAFRRGEFEAGALAGVRAVGALLARHYPPHADQVNELPDRPTLL